MRKRMVWWREAKWLLAGHLLNAVLELTKKEMSAPMAASMLRLATDFKNDEKFNTVPMHWVIK